MDAVVEGLLAGLLVAAVLGPLLVLVAAFMDKTWLEGCRGMGASVVHPQNLPGDPLLQLLCLVGALQALQHLSRQAATQQINEKKTLLSKIFEIGQRTIRVINK